MDDRKLVKKRSAFKKIFAFICIVLIILIGSAFFVVSWYNNAVNNPIGTSDDRFTFEVKEGDTLSGIASQLKSSGLIKSDIVLKIYLREKNLTPNIKPGIYTISGDVNLPEVIQIFEKGVLKPSVVVTLKEGYRATQIADAIDAESETLTKFDKNEFLKIVNNPDAYSFSSDVATFLNNNKPAGNNLEGFLYPDTYFFDIDMDSKAIVDFMLVNFKEKITEAGIDVSNVKASQSNLDSLYEAIILASIIEKEASLTDDRSLIAGVFHNRLRDSFLLQSDATVNYVTGKNDAGVLIEDTKVDSPYNTYKYTGLPPAPISNPRIESITAALKPKATSYYYFLHDSKGNSYFAETFQQHQVNVEKYLN